MSEIISSQPIALPEPSVPIAVRVGTREDIPFMDALQKQHGKALGFFSRKMFEGYIDAGNVLIAEAANSLQPTAGSGGGASSLQPTAGSGGGANSLQPTAGSALNTAGCSLKAVGYAKAVGYCISKDRYLKRDELGAVFQLCVVPGRQRGFIGANLLREVFERSAYGCKLYCCWCAQDLAANKFWEAMGFVPIAYRAGGKARGKARSRQPAARSEGESLQADSCKLQAGTCKLRATPRLHIFWQKRIRAGDTTTPYWFPAKTEGGAMREDRIILPIPLDRHWNDELPRLLPGAQETSENRPAVPAIGDGRPQRKRRTLDMTPPPSDGRARGAKQFDGPSAAPAVAPCPRVEAQPAIEKAKPMKKPTARADTALIAAARELKDRWLEQLNAHPEALLPMGKYDVARQVQDARPTNLLAA